MSPMTVRWKPLLVLSGLFLVTAVMGLMAIVYAMMPRGSADLLGLARADRRAHKYDNAVVQYRRALQKDGKDAGIHLEMADLYAEWSDRLPAGAQAEKRAELRVLQLRALAEAAKFDKRRAAPRRRLLADALGHDEAAEAAHWAGELLGLEPGDLDAHYVMADRALTDGQVDLAEARKHLDALDGEAPPRLRTDWVRARLAEEARDDKALAEVLDRARRADPPADPVDRMALLRLRSLDAQRAADPAALADRADAVRRDAMALVQAKDAPSTRITQLGELLDKLRVALARASAKSRPGPAVKARLAAVTGAIDEAIEAAFKKATDPAQPVDLRVARAYAAHLMIRDQRAECLAVVDKALKAPIAALPAFQPEAMDLREVAVKAALADTDDPQRFAKAARYIKELLDNPTPRYQGLGHLFQGAIDLERSGLVGATGAAAVDGKLRASALAHLREAAEQWTNSATAQALYGVALILSNESALGRQHLQEARKLGGNLEPRYQIWAAWSMSEAGYPEDADPIVRGLLDQLDRGQLPRELEGTLHLLAGEVAQSRGGKGNFARAEDEYRKAFATGQAVPAAVALRLAQLEVLNGKGDDALARLARLREKGKGGPAVDRLAAMILLDRAAAMAKDQAPAGAAKAQLDAARKLLDDARGRFPEDADLAGLDAALLARDGQSEEAARRLGAFLSRNPENVPALQMRAQILAERVKGGAAEARKLLARAADHADNTGPLVQLALLDLNSGDLDAAGRSVARLRARWKEAAAADLLDAQIAARRDDPRAAARHLEAALKKDPGNKVALFWKAQLDDRSGASGEAARVYQQIARQNPGHEVIDGLSLAAASRWALATQALEAQDFDVAIAGYRNLLRDGTAGTLARPARWKLVAAYATKGRWPEAKKELTALLGEPPVSADERVQAANYFRLNGEDAAAIAQLDTVLKADPAQPGAVVTRAFMMIGAERPTEAVALIEQAIAAAKVPPAPAVYLMLAAIENQRDASAEGLRKARAALDRGLAAHPDALDLIKAEARVLKLAGDGKAALAFVEARAQADPKGPARRLLVDLYREEGEPAKAEGIAAELAKADPKDPAAAALVIRLVGARAAAAAEAGDRAGSKALLERQATLIRQGRAAFPADLAILEADCDLAARRNDMPRALAITKEMDALDAGSVAGPLLRARIYEAQGWGREAADAYAEAAARNPRRADLKLAWGQAALNAGKADEAVRQANFVLEGSPEAPPARLLKARGLAAQGGSDAARTRNREEAIGLLRKVLAAQPKAAEAHRLLAEVLLMQGRRAEARAALREAVKAAPDDPATLAASIQHLAEPPARGSAPDPAALAEAAAQARAAADRDPRGELALAAAVGYQRAGQLALALPLAGRAAGKVATPAAHLSYGDLLLSAAEAEADAARARDLFRQAVAQYDLVLKAQPASVEAVNNKAWILHRHLGDDKAALALAEGLIGRVSDPSALPGEFYDTLGEIQESLGRARDAEVSYAKGLDKAPDLPVLNFHMGRLVAADRSRAEAAADYLQKARRAGDRLRPADRAKVADLLAEIGR